MTPRPLFLVLLLLFTLSATAQQTNNELAFSFGHSELNQLGEGPAFGVAWNRFLGHGFSTRFGIFAAAEDLRAGGAENTIGAAHISGEYHLFRTRLVSPYVGAGAALAVTKRRSRSSHFSGSESQLLPILDGGIDVNLSPRFAVGTEIRYLNYEAEALDERLGYVVDPVTVLISAKLRY